MSAQPEGVVTSTPDPTLVALVSVLIRYLLAIGSVLGVMHGATSDSIVQMLASSVVGVATVGWALWNKLEQYKHTHAVAQANAARPAGSTPVQPTQKRGLLSA